MGSGKLLEQISAQTLRIERLADAAPVASNHVGHETGSGSDRYTDCRIQGRLLCRFLQQGEQTVGPGRKAQSGGNPAGQTGQPQMGTVEVLPSWGTILVISRVRGG